MTHNIAPAITRAMGLIFWLMGRCRHRVEPCQRGVVPYKLFQIDASLLGAFYVLIRVMILHHVRCPPCCWQ